MPKIEADEGFAFARDEDRVISKHDVRNDCQGEAGNGGESGSGGEGAGNA